MQYIAFDFETSGLPDGRHAAVTSENINKFDGCRAVSLSAARFSSRGRLLDTFDAIVYPGDFQIGPESVAVHGITQDRALQEGRPFTEIFVDFVKFIGHRVTILVAHNAKFDKNVLHSEMIRHGLDFECIKHLDIRCTLELYRSIFLKPIRLGVLYKEIFGVEFENAHNSLADCIACGKVYPYLRDYEKRFKPIRVPKIIIGASSVASAIGVGFKKQHELIEEIWKKYKPETFDGKTKDEEALEVLRANPITNKILTDASMFESSDSGSVGQKVRAVFHQIEHSHMEPRDMLLTKNYLQKLLYTNHGTRNESVTADADDANLTEDDTYYTYDICNIEGTLYQIVGRIDRIQHNEDGSRTLVEIKNRTRRLFGTVRDYEYVQCQTYLQMLKDIRYCRLLEQFNDERKSHLIERNDARWNDEFLPKLETFCEVLHTTLSKT